MILIANQLYKWHIFLRVIIYLSFALIGFTKPGFIMPLGVIIYLSFVLITDVNRLYRGGLDTY